MLFALSVVGRLEFVSLGIVELGNRIYFEHEAAFFIDFIKDGFLARFYHLL